MIFVCAGLGGGTGSGAAPFVAEMARESGALVIVFATLPFGFEGKRRTNQAQEALNRLNAIANAVIDALSPLGIRHLDLPLTPEKIWRALQPAKPSAL